MPPGYEGPLPEGGYFTRRTRTTRLLLLGGRAFLENDDPKPAVERIKEGLRIHRYVPGYHGTSIGEIVTGGTAPPLPWTAQTWTAALHRPDPPRFVEGSGLAVNTVPPADATYFDLASELVHDQPAEALDPEIAGALAAIGIAKGRPFEPDARMRKILTEAAAVGNATARTLACRPRPEEGAHYYGASSRWVNGLLASGYDFMTPPRTSPTGVSSPVRATAPACSTCGTGGGTWEWASVRRSPHRCPASARSTCSRSRTGRTSPSTGAGTTVWSFRLTSPLPVSGR
ncbi:hypothetical protein ACWDLL_21635 [Streptomyces griseoincarnatus]